jgi:hypothetical protein
LFEVAFVGSNAVSNISTCPRILLGKVHSMGTDWRRRKHLNFIPNKISIQAKEFAEPQSCPSNFNIFPTKRGAFGIKEYKRKGDGDTSR